ncbi:hypothetical protein ACN38_g11317 [Penicillium nordicum]|uniref:Uncharacterized protein n=1 Tax=Penicillium nordicum TaxID=229535 RepID=A0A0M9WB83_9EURO|nr:hypothetical protein ACN38_g11317 [Penicillium nordicum]
MDQLLYTDALPQQNRRKDWFCFQTGRTKFRKHMLLVKEGLSSLQGMNRMLRLQVLQQAQLAASMDKVPRALR